MGRTVHMNGRVYDPYTARFLSADPYVQDPRNGQSYNRYSYVLNNPTNLTDPTGFESVTIPGHNDNTVCRGPEQCAAFVSDLKARFRSDARRACAGSDIGCTNRTTQAKIDASGVAKIDAKQANVSVFAFAVEDDAGNVGAALGVAYGDPLIAQHYAEYLRSGAGGGDGPTSVAAGYDGWAYGMGYMSKEEYQERAQARATGAAIGGAAVGAAAVMTLSSTAATGEYLVYEGLDAAGSVRYVGITSRTAAERFAEHLRAIGTGKELLQYRVIRGLEGLSKIEARVEEQMLINRYGLQKTGGQLLNRINSIAKEFWKELGIK